ncbi:hypothetical protein L226DRAFT_559710 [Lentinus tigrinus ALCF2SS1-7]|uniref:uncharacterized protein n=1 Tax=Lentinus tigrinus ALCF2SS1-7 TaxID=1328758 RepID=UPI001165D5CD|nr:hypothetical protein L226DRAFT_559710 [Lentinus tigrinus ALCF2SS1-7]
MDGMLDYFRRMVITNPSATAPAAAPPAAQGQVTTAAPTTAATAGKAQMSLKVEPVMMYPIEVNGVPGLRISDWAVKENMEDVWYTYIRDFDLGWKNIEHYLPRDGRPVFLFNLKSLQTDRSWNELVYAHHLRLPQGERPLMLGHLVCQFVRAQWRDYEAATNQSLHDNGLDPQTQDPRIRGPASAWAKLIPLDELYIVAVMRANVGGVEGWFPKIERRRKLDGPAQAQA